MKRILPWLSGASLFFLLLLTVLQQANPLKVFPSLDSGYYLYTGQQILQARQPYVDFWESKPPGIFYLNALGLWLGRGTRWGVWALEFLALSLAAALGWDAMRRRWDSTAAWLGTFCWLLGLNAVLDGGNLTEEFALPLAFLALWALWRSQTAPASRIFPFLLGAAFAGGFLLRANNTASALAGVLTWGLEALLNRDLRTLGRRLFWAGLAVFLLLGGLALAFALSGSFRTLLEAALLFNFSLQKESHGVLPALTGGLNAIGIPAGFGLLGLAAVLASPARRQPWAWGLALALAGEILFSAVSGRGYAHYYILWMPVLGLLSAGLFASLPGLTQPARVWLLPALLGLALLMGGFTTLQDFGGLAQRLAVERGKGVEIDDPAAKYLRENSQPQDLVLVWGGRLGLNVMARRSSPSAVLFYPLLADSPLSAGLAERFYADLQAHPPALIVDTCAVDQDLLPCLDPVTRREQEKAGGLWPFLPENIRQVYAWFDENYLLEKRIQNYVLYRRKR